jgi:hypothetical protein
MTSQERVKVILTQLHDVGDMLTVIQRSLNEKDETSAEAGALRFAVGLFGQAYDELEDFERSLSGPHDPEAQP